MLFTRSRPTSKSLPTALDPLSMLMYAVFVLTLIQVAVNREIGIRTVMLIIWLELLRLHV